MKEQIQPDKESRVSRVAVNQELSAQGFLKKKLLLRNSFYFKLEFELIAERKSSSRLEKLRLFIKSKLLRVILLISFL